MIQRSGGGSCELTRESGSGCSRRIAASVSGAVFRWKARRYLIKDRPEGELIRPEVHPLAACLLGRHVADRPQHDTGACMLRCRGALGGARRRLHELGQAEVQDFDVALL
jgi:hypothetical protein